MTYLELVNRVLRGLREDTVNDLVDDYPLLIAQIVNEAKTDLEDAGPWLALRTSVTASLADTETGVALSGTNERSYLLWEDMGQQGGPAQPMAFLTTSGYERRLRVVTVEEIRSMRALNPNADTGIPEYVALSRSADGLRLEVFPAASGAQSFQFYIVIPQADLSSITDELTIPSEPVWREALVRAMEERGEDFAGPIERATARALDARARAIMMDFGAEPLTLSAE